MRCNTGVPPEMLLDQHLIAEYRELLIPFGQLRSLNFKSPPIPKNLKLGKGHILFWRDKQLYLKRRHEALVKEMRERGFSPNYSFWDLNGIPKIYLNDWAPSFEDSLLLRKRIIEKVHMKPSWYRMRGVNLKEFDKYSTELLRSPVLY